MSIDPYRSRRLVGCRRVVLAAVLSAISITSASAQVVGEIPSGGNLNVTSIEKYETSEPVPIARDDIALVIQTLNAQVPSLAAFLSVLRGVDGRPSQEFVAIPNLGLGEVWHRIFPVTSTRAVMPGSGVDGVFGTLDDEILVIDHLDVPGGITITRHGLGRRGPRIGSHVLVLSDDLVAWLDRGFDDAGGTGDDSIVAIELTAVPQTYDVALPLGGIDADHVVDMEPRRYGLRSAGLDEVLGTGDDDVAMLWVAPDGMPRVSAAGAKLPIFDLPRTPGWPRYLGNGTLIFFTPSAETADFVFVRGLDEVAKITTHPAPMGAFLPQETGPNLAALTEQNVMVFPGLGGDFQPATEDDEMIRVRHPDDGQVVNTFRLPNTLAGRDTRFELMHDVHYLGDGICLAAHSGTDPEFGTDDGLMVIRDIANDEPAIDMFPTFEPVRDIVVMGKGTAAVILDSGLVVYLVANSSTVHALPAIGQLFSFDAEPVAVSPSVFCSFTKGLDGSDPADVVQLWRMPAAYTFGEPSPNGLGHAMEIGTTSLLPNQASPFTITLDSAPPSSFGYLLGAMHRKTIPLLPQVNLLVDPASIILFRPWFTLPSGGTSITLAMPQGQDLRGLTLSFQWLIYSPDSPRRFEVSNGLSLAF